MSLADRQSIARDEAAEWLVLRDPDGHLETPEFQRWLASAPENAEAWETARSLWQAFDDAPDPLLEAMRADALSARPPSSRRAWVATALAACLVAALGLGWSVLGDRPARLAIPLDAAPTLTAASITTYTLADGTRATLEGGSAMVVAFDDRQRAVRLLRGQAYLAIAPESGRRFLTEAGDRTIADLGTEFAVAVRPQGVEVVLVKGKVAVSGRSRIELAPGQRLRTSRGGVGQVDQPPMDQALAWREPTLDFRGRPLEAVVAEINRYGGPPARIMDPRVAKLKVGGAFKAGDPTRFAKTLAELYPLALRSRPDGGVDIRGR